MPLSTYQQRWSSKAYLLPLISLCLATWPLSAMTITGYSGEKNDRFSDGYPTAPIRNTHPDFIGLDYDWSGVAWNSSRVRQGVALLSPRHYLFARHFDGISTLQAFDQVGQIQSSNKQSTQATGFGAVFLGETLGDLSIGTVSQNFSTVARYGILDLNDSSLANSPNNYNGLDLFLYGHGNSETASTRIGETPVSFAGISGNNHQFRTTRDDVQLVTFDSGSPAFAKWINPNGFPELALIGNHAAIDEENNLNFHSLASTYQVMDKLNEFMNVDGFALRLVGNPSYTWVGSDSINIERDQAWGTGNNHRDVGASNDKYVLLDADTAASTSVNVDTNYNLRGLYFKSSETGGGFSFSGNSTLTIGRGGVTNYDNNTQTFVNNLTLGTSQYWLIESGAANLSTLSTNGHLLEIGGTGNTSVSGNITGSGSLALSEGTLNLSGDSTYTGNTWVHGGELIVDGDIGSSAELILGIDGTLSGTGITPRVSGSGLIEPGNSPGILTCAAISPAISMDFAFEFTAASSPDFGAPTNSINDLLRLTDATPLTAPLDSSNTVSIYLNVSSVEDAQQYRGGFFTDTDTDFLTSISEATITFYIADPSGNVSYNGQTYSEYSGIYLFGLSTPSQSADFDSGTVNGRILQIETQPDQSQYAGWQVFYDLTGTNAENDADTDFDGIPQLLEFAFGGDPNVNNLRILPTEELVEDGTSTYLELSVTRPIDLQGITYTPQTTPDLTNWPSNSLGIVDATPTPNDNGDGTETLVYRRSQPVSEVDQAFIRVDISETP